MKGSAEIIDLSNITFLGVERESTLGPPGMICFAHFDREEIGTMKLFLQWTQRQLGVFIIRIFLSSMIAFIGVSLPQNGHFTDLTK